MNVFVFALVLCATGIPHALSQDLPEVVAAKAAHFEAVKRAELLIANAPPVDKNEYRPPVLETSQHQLGLNVQDTPEVAAAKVAHYEAVRDAEQATAVANATNRYQPDIHVDIHRPSGSFSHHSSSSHNPAPIHYPSSSHYPSSGHYPSHGHYPSSGHHTVPSYHPSHSTPVYRPDHGHHTVPAHHHHYVTDVHYHPVHGKSTPVVYTTQHKLGVNVQDTPEVAAAKAAHFDAIRQAEQAAATSDPNDDSSYFVHSNEAPIPVVPVASIISPIPDTPEVAAAKAAHFEAVRLAQAVAGPDHSGHYVPMTENVVYMPVIYHPNMVPVVPVPQTNQHQLGVNVEDTPEVAAAKAAHFAAFRQAQLVAAENEEVKSGPYNNFYANTARQYGQVPY